MLGVLSQSTFQLASYTVELRNDQVWSGAHLGLTGAPRRAERPLVLHRGHFAGEVRFHQLPKGSNHGIRVLLEMPGLGIRRAREAHNRESRVTNWASFQRF